jgi:hypothetical protein
MMFLGAIAPFDMVMLGRVSPRLDLVENLPIF